MDKKNIIVSTVISIAVVLLGFAYFGRPINTIERFTDRITEKAVTKHNDPEFGAVSGPSVDSEVFSINGIKRYYLKQAMISATQNGGTATGTACVFKLPSASTTLQDYSAVLTTNAPTTTSILTLYHTLGGFSTTSSLQIDRIPSTIAANGRLIASTTATSTLSTNRPSILRGSNGGEDNAFLVFDVQGGSSPFTGQGVCTVELKELL